MAARYDMELAKLPITLPPKAKSGDTHSWHLYVIRLKDDAPVSRDEFIAQMTKRGIGCSVHFIPLHLHPYWRDTYRLKPEEFPNSSDGFQRCVSLPIYTKMSDNDQSRVITAINEILS